MQNYQEYSVNDENLVELSKNSSEIEEENLNIYNANLAKKDPSSNTENLQKANSSKLNSMEISEVKSEDFNGEEIHKNEEKTMPIIFKNTENLVKPEEFAISKHTETEVPTHNEIVNIVLLKNDPKLNLSLEDSSAREQLIPIQDLPELIKR